MASCYPWGSIALESQVLVLAATNLPQCYREQTPAVKKSPAEILVWLFLTLKPWTRHPIASRTFSPAKRCCGDDSIAYITRLLERLNPAIHIKLLTKCLASMQLSVDGYCYEFLMLEFLIPSYFLYFYSQWASVNQPVLFMPWVWGQWHWPSLSFHNKEFLKIFALLLCAELWNKWDFEIKEKMKFQSQNIPRKKIACFTFPISCLSNRLCFWDKVSCIVS